LSGGIRSDTRRRTDERTEVMKTIFATVFSEANKSCIISGS